MESSGLVGGIAQAVNAHGSETAGNTDTSLQGTPEAAQVKTEQPKDAEQIAANQPNQQQNQQPLFHHRSPN